MSRLRRSKRFERWFSSISSGRHGKEERICQRQSSSTRTSFLPLSSSIWCVVAAHSRPELLLTPLTASRSRRAGLRIQSSRSGRAEEDLLGSLQQRYVSSSCSTSCRQLKRCFAGSHGRYSANPTLPSTARASRPAYLPTSPTKPSPPMAISSPPSLPSPTPAP